MCMVLQRNERESEEVYGVGEVSVCDVCVCACSFAYFFCPGVFTV